MPRLPRSEWYDLTRDINWQLSYVSDEEAFPEDLSTSYGVPTEAWWVWDEPYKVTYAEYVHNQHGKDASVYAVNAVVGRSRIFEQVYLAGPPAMVDATLPALRTAGVPLNRVHYDRFG